MFNQKIKFSKKYKLNQLQQIQQTYKYIYIFRYLDCNINDTILLKKKIKKFSYKSFSINQTLITNFLPNLNGQGPLLMIYGHNDLNLIQCLKIFFKLELIYLRTPAGIYSNLKIKQIQSIYNSPLNSIITQPFLNFLYYLRKI